MSFKENSKIYYGLDIGTDSVGWSTTNEKYELLRYKNNLMWGVSLFEAASLAEERRGHRTQRRRYDRRQQRVALLGELFAKEILKTDPDFFLRLKESSLYPEDRTSKNVNTYFDDADFKDSDYFKMYPTVHHLIKELSESNKPHDVRLVYLACAFIVAHRGHFLNGADENNVQAVLDFDSSYCEFTDWFKSNDIEDNPFSESVKNEFSVILRKKIGITAKEREIKNLLFGTTKTPDCYKDEEYPIDIDVLIKFISGGKTNLAKLFRNPSYDELDIQTVEVGKADFADTIDLLASSMEDTDVPLLSAVKAMYDWSLLIDVLKGQKTISDAKVCEYEQHKSDLKALKYIVRKYLDRAQYDEIFRTAGEKPNYVSYSYNVTDVKLKQLPSNFKKKNSEEFCKYIKSKLEKIKPESDDEAVYNELIEKCNSKTLCPKQVTDENRVIPYQLYYHELSMILDKASAYLDFLNKTEDGISVKQKILTLMKFRIPYFVGPLVKRNETDNVWIVRKAEGRIYPWNFENMVDFDKSEDGFIRRMTCKCTYLAGEDVLPKYSLLYSKYTVLNEINNIKVNGEKISPELKQDIFNELFMKTSRVTVKKITELLKRKGAFSEEKGDSLSGVDINIKSSLKSYLDFRRLLENGSLSENDVERIIERITVTTDKPRLVSWLKAEYSDLPAEDIRYISRLSYKDYGRLSAKLLTGCYELDTNTGEIGGRSIIDFMWAENINLMQILSDSYGYKSFIEEENKKYFMINPTGSIAQTLREMYVSPSVSRAIIRTMEIVKELRKITKKDPDKIFVEMARGGKPEEKGKRTSSRREQIEKLYDSAKAFVSDEDISHLRSQLGSLSDEQLRSEKYYLYFIQFGKCMYSGEAIDFSRLGDNHCYDIDHIFPQSKINDDSLHNKVLVKSQLNGEKSDDYPIKAEIRNKMHPIWKNLFYRDPKNPTDKVKYERLTRSTPFTEDELAGFIERQLVETRQSTKAVATLLKEMFPDSKIVYVKAGQVSEFRHDFDMLKCREINDLHHAKDAYLNIVIGNVHDVKFTSNPMNFVKNADKHYTIKVKETLKHKVSRNGETAWNPETDFDTVKRMMSKNSVRYVRYCYKRKGELFDQQPKKAGNPDLARLKKDLDPVKYGGYNSKSISCFSLIKCTGVGAVIIPVELLCEKRYFSDDSFASEYAYSVLKNALPAKNIAKISIDDISFPLKRRPIKINTLFEFDGYRVNIRSKDSYHYFTISSAMAAIYSKDTSDYIKAVSSYIDKSDKGSKFKPGEAFDVLSNLKVYDEIAKKCISEPFSKISKLAEAGKKMEEGRDKFAELSIIEQMKTLLLLVDILKTGRINMCNLKPVGGVESYHTERMSAILKNTKYSDIRIIDQSPTGLYEKKSDNLLEL